MLSVATGLLAAAACAGCGAAGDQGATTPERAKAPAPRVAAATKDCDRWASPRGSDSARGTRRRPVRTVSRLAQKLRKGQTGCLVRGVYEGGGVANLTRPQTALRGVGRGRARVRQPIWVRPGADGASVSRIMLTSRLSEFPIPLKVQADRVVIARNRIFGSRQSICILAGSEARADDLVIERNRISNCGRTGKFDHLLYLFDTRRVRVRGNILTGNHGGWAVHLYSNSDDGIIENNIMDGNLGGVIFAGDGSETSDRNIVRNNAITFSGPRFNIEGSWSGGPAGPGNVATANCVGPRRDGAPGGIAGPEGFTAVGNVTVASSPYVDRRRGDFRFKRSSRCRRLVENALAQRGR